MNVTSPDTVVCFTSEKKAEAAMRRDLRANRIPAGFTTMPPEGKKAELLAAPAEEEKAQSSRRSIKAKASHHCGRSYNNVWTGGNFNDNHSYYGYTGPNSWLNFSGVLYNDITSYKHAHYFTDQWDYFERGGEY